MKGDVVGWHVRELGVRWGRAFDLDNKEEKEKRDKPVEPKCCVLNRLKLSAAQVYYMVDMYVAVTHNLIMCERYQCYRHASGYMLHPV